LVSSRGSRLCAFARPLGVPAAWFFDGLPEIKAKKTRIAIPLHELESRETAALLKAYYRVADPNRRRAVYRLIQSIAGTRPA
jgi:hypothetical protein